MKNWISFLFFLYCSVPRLIHAQKLEIKASPANLNAYKILMSSRKFIRENQVVNEKVADLVYASTYDSTLRYKRDFRRFFLLRPIALAGYRWNAIGNHKVKYIGSADIPMNIPRKQRLQEYDINFNLIPHTPKYMDDIYQYYQAQWHQARRLDTIALQGKAPWIRPNSSNINRYWLHCECTPAPRYREALNNLFYPTIRGYNPLDHPAFGIKAPAIGLYGTPCMDCYHKCHPEIHSYEWIWWPDLHPSRDTASFLQNWYLGLMTDHSNNVKRFSSIPRAGTISIPVVFNIDKKAIRLKLSKLVVDKLDKKSFQKYIKVILPQNNHTIQKEAKQFSLSLGTQTIKLSIDSDTDFDAEACRFWISDVSFDSENNIGMFRFNLAVATKGIFTAKLISY